jgi:hypothetical protein
MQLDINTLMPNNYLELGTALGATIAGTLVYFFRWKKKRKEAYNIEYWKTHSDIHESLTELRLQCDAARTQLVQFHNGEYFIDGISMKKLSMTHESLHSGVSAQYTKMREILISMFIEHVQSLLSETVVIRKIGQLKSSIFRQILETDNVEAYMAITIKYKGKITGYIMVQWCNRVTFETIDIESCKKALEKAKDSIEVSLLQQKATDEK